MLGHRYTVQKWRCESSESGRAALEGRCTNCQYDGRACEHRCNRHTSGWTGKERQSGSLHLTALCLHAAMRLAAAVCAQRRFGTAGKAAAVGGEASIYTAQAQAIDVTACVLCPIASACLGVRRGTNQPTPARFLAAASYRPISRSSMHVILTDSVTPVPVPDECVERSSVLREARDAGDSAAVRLPCDQAAWRDWASSTAGIAQPLAVAQVRALNWVGACDAAAAAGAGLGRCAPNLDCCRTAVSVHTVRHSSC